MKKHSNKEDSNEIIYWSVMLIFISLGMFTYFHELLHQFAAFVNGWSISSSQSGLLTGSTDAIAKLKEVTVQKMIFFYLFPSVFIILGTFALNLLNPNRWLRIAGLISISLNVASLDVGISGSDMQKAAEYAIAHGYPNATLYAFLVFFIFIVLYALWIYLATENSDKDFKARVKSVVD